MDFCVLTSGSVIKAADACRTMLVFNDKNVAGEKLDNAPTMNDYFGTKLPAMFSARAFGIHKAAVDAHPIACSDMDHRLLGVESWTNLAHEGES